MWDDPGEQEAAAGNSREHCTWKVRRLWDLARDLPIETVEVASLLPLLQLSTCYGPQNPPSNYDVALHAKRAMASDLSYPLILSSKGWIFDGVHRLIKAWMLDIPTVQVVRFVKDPEPDTRIQLEAAADDPQSH